MPGFSPINFLTSCCQQEPGENLELILNQTMGKILRSIFVYLSIYREKATLLV